MLQYFLHCVGQHLSRNRIAFVVFQGFFELLFKFSPLWKHFFNVAAEQSNSFEFFLVIVVGQATQILNILQVGSFEFVLNLFVPAYVVFKLDVDRTLFHQHVYVFLLGYCAEQLFLVDCAVGISELIIYFLYLSVADNQVGEVQLLEHLLKLLMVQGNTLLVIDAHRLLQS